MNTKFEQVFLGNNLTEFTKIDRPKNDKATTKIFGLIFLLVLLSSGAVYFFSEGKGLINSLPADTKFYASVSLPPETKWYSALLFWPVGNKPNAAVSRLYPKLDLISWDKVSWPEKILPLLSGRLELARLPGGAGRGDGGLLLKARLKDKAAWFSLFGLEENGYQGEVVSRDLALSPWWSVLTKNPNKIVWQILGNDLYIADNENILFDLSKKNSNSLAKVLKNMKVKTGLASFYIKDKDSLVIDNPYIKALDRVAAYPLAISFTQAPGSLNFAIISQKYEPIRIKSSVLASRLNDFDSAFYAQNLAATESQWAGALPEDLKNNFWLILQDFYGVDKAEALTEIGSAEIFLTFSGSDWLLNIADNKGKNDNLLVILKKAATAMFAITHPRAVEQKLADGSSMVELRADSEGLDWQEEPWSYASQAVNIQSLRGKGEPGGYYTGFVPELGYILTTAMPLLNYYAAKQPMKPQSGCVAPKNMLMGASLPVNNLTNDAWWRSLAKKIIITMSQGDKINGCALLLD